MVQAEPQPADIQNLSRQLDELTDLFRRRLLDDREKARALTALQGELDHAREGIRRQVLEPVIRQLILVLDRIDATHPRTGFIDSIAAEILELLEQYGVRRVNALHVYDSGIADAIGVYETTDEALDGAVASVERSGYLWSGALLRPAAVTVWRVAAR